MAKVGNLQAYPKEKRRYHASRVVWETHPPILLSKLNSFLFLLRIHPKYNGNCKKEEEPIKKLMLNLSCRVELCSEQKRSRWSLRQAATLVAGQSSHIHTLISGPSTDDLQIGEPSLKVTAVHWNWTPGYYWQDLFSGQADLQVLHRWPQSPGAISNQGLEFKRSSSWEL